MVGFQPTRRASKLTRFPSRTYSFILKHNVLLFLQVTSSLLRFMSFVQPNTTASCRPSPAFHNQADSQAAYAAAMNKQQAVAPTNHNSATAQVTSALQMPNPAPGQASTQIDTPGTNMPANPVQSYPVPTKKGWPQKSTRSTTAGTGNNKALQGLTSTLLQYNLVASWAVSFVSLIVPGMFRRYEDAAATHGEGHAVAMCVWKEIGGYVEKDPGEHVESTHVHAFTVNAMNASVLGVHAIDVYAVAD